MASMNITTTDTTTTLISASTSSGLDKEEIVEIFFRILLYVIGVVGNLLVIFVILFLNEFRKITHWYVLQLALADLLFLQTLPFRISEIVNDGWIHSMQLCQAKQTILYFNYYASIMFLMVMAIDRYLAVCHALSTRIQRMRSRTYSFITTGITWLVSLVMCIPVMMYSGLVKTNSNCICSFDFPKDKERWCQINYGNQSAEEMKDCMDTMFDLVHKEESCISSGDQPSAAGNSSGESGFDYDLYGDSGELFSGLYGVNGNSETPPNAGKENREIIHSGCIYTTDTGFAWHAFVYFNFFVMFVIPLIVISACYILIVNRIMTTTVGDRRTSNVDSTYSANGSRKKFWRPRRRSSTTSSGQSYREKMRVTLLCAVFVLLFIVCWLPFHSVHLAKIIGIASEDPQFCLRLGKATSMLAYLNSAINPYLYNFLGTFQKRIKQVRNHKRMRSFLSATGITRLAGRSSSVVNSSDASKGKRADVPNESRTASIPNEKIQLKPIVNKSATEFE